MPTKFVATVAGAVSNPKHSNQLLIMKERSKLLAIVSSAILISGCGDSGVNTPTPAPSAAKPKGSSGIVAAPMSYSQHVGTIFMASCADCHIKDSKGGFSMATFASLMKGGENGPVIVPGKPDESKLLKLIESGEMPPEGRGTALLDDDKAGLREWIANGAKFDGPDKDAMTEEYVRMPEAGTDPGGGGGGGGRGGRGGGGGGNWNPMERLDQNGDKKISKEEMPERMRERFDELDKDKDGALTEEEFRAGMQGRGRGGRGGEGGGRGGEGGGRGEGEGGGRGGERSGATAPAEGKTPERPPFDDQ